MNSTTASPAAAASLSVGVSPRADSRKLSASEQAGPGDFQRMLTQAAEKKSAAQRQQTQQQQTHQQQTRQHESRQTEQRLLDNKRQESRLQESRAQDNRLQEQQRQASIGRSHAEEAMHSGRPSAAHDQAASPDDRVPSSSRQVPQETAADESSETTASSTFSDNPEKPEPVTTGSEPMSAQEAVGSAEPIVNNLPLLSGIGTPASVSLEEIAQSVIAYSTEHPVMGVSGVAVMRAEGAMPGRESAAGTLTGVLRSPQAAFYSNAAQLAPAEGATANTEGAMADDASVVSLGLGVAAVTRHLTGAAGAPQALDQLVTGGQLTEINAESGSSRETAPGSPLTAPGQAPDGKSAPLMGAPSNPSANVRGALGQPEWHNAIAERVAVMASKNLTSAEIQLDPPELGQLLVRVTLNQEQASVNFSSQNAAVREALDQTAQRLREMFDAEGLNLINVDVSDRSFRQQQQQDSSALAGSGAATEEESDAEPVVLRQGQGLIDQFV